MKKFILSILMFTCWIVAFGAPPFISFQQGTSLVPIVINGNPNYILMDPTESEGVKIAIESLNEDFMRITGRKADILTTTRPTEACIIIGSYKTPLIQKLCKDKKLKVKELEGKYEKFLIQTVDNPLPDVKQAIVITGSDKRGTIYGIYELSEQMGVSPWYWWADVPVEKHQTISFIPGTYTDGEPKVKYRGIFLNDEAPCLTNWVKHTYGTNYGDHRFYARVFELILRLRGNFMWPAMWTWAFYADDPQNSETAQKMGIIIGTSHHEPMARNHQEWARKRKTYGKWDYQTNQKVIDQFFREGIERVKDTEDIVTIGMRGDGDEAMSPEADVKLLKKIIKNQRNIIEKVTGKSAKETPQIWALYKEVMDYYDKGLRAPDDVIMLVCDDNWGNVRYLPNEEERKHPGGWGMYYHVDYVGAPRNSKWMNMTPIQNMWEQLQLTYDYGVDKLWILNVGDLKPMEYPISLFLDMAWNPKEFTADNLLMHTKRFCAQQLGEDNAEEAARILNLYCKYNGRVTAEMLDCNTYNLENGEWEKVTSEYTQLEAEALRQYIAIDPKYKDTYKQLILFPVQAMANLYEMYYAQAMNHKLYKANDPQANYWADKVEKAFKRDAELCSDYNNVMSGGKWKNMMTQKHIGYTSWNDNFPADKQPEVFRINDPEKATGHYVFRTKEGVVAIEAEHYFEKNDTEKAKWTVIPYMGRTLSGMALMPYTEPTDSAWISYRMELPKDVQTVNVHIIVKSTLAFKNKDGHRYAVRFDNGQEKTVNFNGELNEAPKNVYTKFYPTVARRVIENTVNVKLPKTKENMHTLYLRPLDPGVVFEKIIVDCGGYQKSYLFMEESPYQRKTN